MTLTLPYNQNDFENDLNIVASGEKTYSLAQAIVNYLNNNLSGDVTGAFDATKVEKLLSKEIDPPVNGKFLKYDSNLDKFVWDDLPSAATNNYENFLELEDTPNLADYSTVKGSLITSDGNNLTFLKPVLEDLGKVLKVKFVDGEYVFELSNLDFVELTDTPNDLTGFEDYFFIVSKDVNDNYSLVLSNEINNIKGLDIVGDLNQNEVMLVSEWNASLNKYELVIKPITVNINGTTKPINEALIASGEHTIIKPPDNDTIISSINKIAKSIPIYIETEVMTDVYNYDGIITAGNTYNSGIVNLQPLIHPNLQPYFEDKLGMTYPVTVENLYKVPAMYVIRLVIEYLIPAVGAIDSYLKIYPKGDYVENRDLYFNYAGYSGSFTTSNSLIKTLVRHIPIYKDTGYVEDTGQLQLEFYAKPITYDSNFKINVNFQVLGAIIEPNLSVSYSL